VTVLVTPVLGVLAHVVHYTLIVGGTVVVALLLFSARPGRKRLAGNAHDPRVVELRAAAAAGRLASVGAPTPPVAERDPVPSPVPQAREVTADDATVLLIALVSSAAAAGVHAAAGPVHFREGLLIGGFFVVSALAQLAWSMVLMVQGPDRRLLWAGLLGNAAVVLLWAVTRTVGLPFGLVAVEAVGTWDLAATAWEVVIVGCCALALSRGFARGTHGLLDMVRWSAGARIWLVGSVVVMVLLTFTGAPA